MARYYYIGPWIWTQQEPGQFVQDPETKEMFWVDPQYAWCGPEGQVGCIDLRPYAACAQAGGTHPQNYGLFVTEKPLLDAKYTLLASDLDAAIKPDVLEAVATKLKTGTLKAKSVRELLVELLTTHADPTQVDRTSCLMPKQNGMMEIWLAGERVWERPFGGESDPAWPNIQKVVQQTYRETRERALNVLDSTPADLHRKRLTDWQGKFGISDYTKFIPDDLPTETPAAKATTIGDTFVDDAVLLCIQRRDEHVARDRQA